MARRTPDLTPDRTHRLCKMLMALGKGPLGKDALVKKLKVEERGFFRDLAFLRSLGIDVGNNTKGYFLAISLDDAFCKLPIPDLRITLSDALELSHGPTPAQRRVRKKLESVIGPVSDFENHRPRHRLLEA